jgi:hypothetical protein
MITALNISTSPVTSAWFNSHANEAVVSVRLFMTGTGLVRIEGRNLPNGTATPIGLLYSTGSMLVPRFNQYRVVVVQLSAGARVESVDVGPSISDDEYGPAASPRLQYRGRPDSFGHQAKSRAPQFVLPFDLLPGTGTIGSDRCRVETGTGSKDYTNCWSGEVQTSETRPYSINLTGTANQTTEIRYDYRVSSSGPGGQDISGSAGVPPTMFARFYADPTNANTLATSNINLVTFTMQNGANVHSQWLAQYNQMDASACAGPGWLEITENMIPAGAFTHTSVDLFRFFVQPRSGQAASITFDTVQFLQNDPSKRYVAFRDDDCFPDVWRVAREFDKRGILGTFFCKPRLVGTSVGATLADIRAMQRAGHFIAHQGWSRFEEDTIGSSTFNYMQQSPEEFYTKNILPAMWWMQDNDFAEGARVFAPEQGNMTCEQREYAYQRGIDIISQTNTCGGTSNHINHPRLLRNNFTVLYGGTAVGAADRLDTIGGVLIYTGHDTTSAGNATMASVMNRVMPGVKDGTYKCITFADMIGGLS